MRKTVFCVIGAALFWHALTAPAYSAPRRSYAEEPSDVSVGLSLGYLNGHTTYHIANYGIDPATNTIEGIESELEFPLNTPFFGLEGSVITKDRFGRDAWRVSLGWLMTLGDGSGKMKDSDWATDGIDIATVGVAHPGKDIYSESDITLSGTIIDIRVLHNAWVNDRFALGPLAGYRYEKFSYEVSNLRQVGFGPYGAGPTSFSGTFPGKVLNYEVTYTIPYLGVHSTIQGGRRFQTDLDIGYSPIVSAEDRDDHILRTKLSTGSTSGTAYLAALSLLWSLEESDSFTIRGEYLKIQTEGTQTQRWYGNTPGEPPAGTSFSGVSDRITSQQLSATLLFTHRF